jgi:hypothetical protein
MDKFDSVDGDSSSNTELVTAEDALQYIDAEWYSIVSKRARWMDLLGDYAGSETFIVDGAFSVRLAILFSHSSIRGKLMTHC